MNKDSNSAQVYTSIFTNLFTTIIAILFSLWLYNSDINKSLDAMSVKFDNILLKDGNTITKDQAKTVAKMYLKDVKLDMILRIQSYLNSDFKEHVKKSDIKLISLTLENISEDVIQDTRAGLANFDIIGGENFEEFLRRVTPLDSGIIQSAKNEMVKEITQSINHGKSNPEEIASALLLIIDRAGKDSELLITKELDKIYS
jgi:fatty acid-binding protein DegV